jgi:hypothetical protein
MQFYIDWGGFLSILGGLWDKMRYDVDLRFRCNYKTKRGEMYLKLKQEYGVDGSRLVERVFEDANLIIAARSERRAAALRKKEEADRELLEIVAGSKKRVDGND